MSINLKSVKDVGSVRGKRVLVRIDSNVPIEHTVVGEDYRIKRIMPTLLFLHEHGAQVVILGHHSRETQTLKPVADYLNRLFPTQFFLRIQDVPAPHEREATHTLFFLENLRFSAGEKSNDLSFARSLAEGASAFVNDAFAVSHRKHASVVLLPSLLPHYVGFLFDEEIRNLSFAFDPPHPFVFVLGGAKPATKLPLASAFAEIADTVFLGGAVAHNCFRERGYEIGRSFFEEINPAFLPVCAHTRVMLPFDVIVEKDGNGIAKSPNGVLTDERIVDAGSKTLAALKKKIQEAAFVLWNGPLGDTELGFFSGTRTLIDAIEKSSARSVVGGGDTIAVIAAHQKMDAFDFISTGGGAMLQFLLHRTLPGIDALRK